MTAQKTPGPILEAWQLPPTPVDELAAVMRVGALTHLIFTVRLPSTDPAGGIERVAQARLIVPTDQLQAIGKIICAGRIDPTVGTGEDGEAAPLH